MANIEVAKQRIREEKQRGGSNLRLDNLGLTSEDLDQLIPIIAIELQNITDLYLDYNAIERLPDSIGDLKNLLYLYLNNNKLKKLPDNIGNLSNLLYLYLNNNEMTTLPDSLGNLNNLRWLDLDQNNITTLPDSMGNLKNLKWLNLDSNEITIVPETFGNLSALNLLNLNHNNLKNLPENIKNLCSLISLFLDNNNLEILPASVCTLPNLRNVALSENPLSLVSLLDIGARNESQSIFHLNKAHSATLDQMLKEPSTGVKNIARSVADDYPTTSIDEFNILLGRLSTNQLVNIGEFELPYSKKGIGFDIKGNLSNELAFRDMYLGLN